jgi:hypothetical protein
MILIDSFSLNKENYIILSITYITSNIIAYMVHGYAVFANEYNKEFNFNTCIIYHNYMKSRFYICSFFVFFLCPSLYIYKNKRILFKCVSFTCSKLNWIRKESTQAQKVNNDDMIEKQYHCMQCTELLCIFLCICYQFFFIWIDTSVAYKYTNQNLCYNGFKDNANIIQWLDISIIINIIMNSLNACLMYLAAVFIYFNSNTYDNLHANTEKYGFDIKN